MRAYSESSQEAVRARDLLKDWVGESFITAEQYAQMEQDTACDLRRTNIFLRIVLFLFTLIVVGAAVGLFFLIFFSRSKVQTTAGILVVFAVVSYAAAEVAVSQFHLYRHGIEEALVACSVGFLCVGMFVLFEAPIFLSKRHEMELLALAAGALASLWIWHRFGLAYASLATMIFVIGLPGHWTSSHAAQHIIVAVLYVLGLIAVVAVRPRHRLTYLNTTYGIAEGLLWLGIYVAINLQISSLDLAGHWLLRELTGTPAATEFSRPFYWTTWVLTWCIPPVILARGLKVKDRFVIAAGAIAACLTMVTNKPYLNWERHTWDPMIFGIALIAVALFVRRWLAQGPGEIRHGFTARRLSGKDKRLMEAGIGIVGMASPNPIAPTAHTDSPDVHFGGGTSGGGGASSDY